MNALTELIKEKEDVLSKILTVKNAKRNKETDMHIAGLTFVLAGIQGAIKDLGRRKKG